MAEVTPCPHCGLPVAGTAKRCPYCAEKIIHEIPQELLDAFLAAYRTMAHDVANALVMPRTHHLMAERQQESGITLEKLGQDISDKSTGLVDLLRASNHAFTAVIKARAGTE